MKQQVDLLVDNAREVVTCAGFSGAPARGAHQGRLSIVPGGAVAIQGARIAAVGPREQVLADFAAPGDRTVDARGGVVLPGFVDPHTHLVFAGDRAAEWEQRMQGKPYLEILREGGGILRTVRATRAATRAELLSGARVWASRCIDHGTTTIEIKTGYRLERDGELELLEVIRELGKELPTSVVATFLGAHVVPVEHRQSREEYLAIVEDAQAEAARRGLAEFADVFCEQEAFTLEETARLLGHARSVGLALKLHAEQFTASGAAALGARLGATSVDHLERIDDAGIRAMAASARPPVGVLLPGAAFHLATGEHPPARRLVEAGVPVALATDLNPGSSFTPSMPMILQIACRALRLTAAEAIVAATINAAHAVGRGAETGSLEVGKRADVIVCAVPDHRWLGYAFGWNPVETVIAGGRRVRGSG